MSKNHAKTWDSNIWRKKSVLCSQTEFKELKMSNFFISFHIFSFSNLIRIDFFKHSYVLCSIISNIGFLCQFISNIKRLKEKKTFFFHRFVNGAKRKHIMKCCWHFGCNNKNKIKWEKRITNPYGFLYLISTVMSFCVDIVVYSWFRAKITFRMMQWKKKYSMFKSIRFKV